MVKKTAPTIQQHKEFGIEVQDIRRRLHSLTIELQKYYPLAIAKLPLHASKTVDRLRSELDHKLGEETRGHDYFGATYCPSFHEQEEAFTSFADIMKEPLVDKSVSSRLSVNSKGATIDGHYFIEKCRIDSAEKLLCWTLHLLEKKWLNSDFMAHFVETVSRHYDIKVRDLSV